MGGAGPGQRRGAHGQGAVPRAVPSGAEHPAEHPATLPGPGCPRTPATAPGPGDGLWGSVSRLSTQRCAAAPGWHRRGPWPGQRLGASSGERAEGVNSNQLACSRATSATSARR